MSAKPDKHNNNIICGYKPIFAFIIFANVLMHQYASAYTSSSFVGHRAPLMSGINVAGRSVLRMEDFGLLRDTGFGFDDIWNGNPVISERTLEKELNNHDIRYRMNRTEKECKENDGLGVDLKIGPLTFKYPNVASIWEAFGFTATSNNEARQKCKLEAQANAAEDPKGLRSKHLGKYGYPRLVGTNGIFYADQLSTDSEPMGGFGMGKSGVIWPVPDIVRKLKNNNNTHI
tara:strand:+ start:550 stop:1242 length:693 start_codon:yes stop_codon:yes gene_type:complete